MEFIRYTTGLGSVLIACVSGIAVMSGASELCSAAIFSAAIFLMILAVNPS